MLGNIDNIIDIPVKQRVIDGVLIVFYVHDGTVALNILRKPFGNAGVVIFIDEENIRLAGGKASAGIACLHIEPGEGN